MYCQTILTSKKFDLKMTVFLSVSPSLDKVPILKIIVHPWIQLIKVADLNKHSSWYNLLSSSSCCGASGRNFRLSLKPNPATRFLLPRTLKSLQMLMLLLLVTHKPLLCLKMIICPRNLSLSLKKQKWNNTKKCIIFLFSRWRFWLHCSFIEFLFIFGSMKGKIFYF